VKTVIAWLGVILATFVALLFIPGADILAWQLLQPANFWQKMILITLETLTAVIRIYLGFLAWVFIVGFTAAITD